MIMKGRAVQYLTAVSVSLVTASMGTFSGWPTPVIPKLNNNETDILVSKVHNLLSLATLYGTAYFISLSLPPAICLLTKAEIGWMLASTSPGFMAGCLVTRFVSDSLGRRSALMASALPMLLGTLVVANAVHATMLYVAKFLWGLGTGMVTTVSTIYLAEISDKDLRATLSMVTRFFFNFGVLLVMSLGPFLSFGLLNWLLLIFPLCFCVASLWMPESPYYHLKVGKVNCARKELSRLQGKSGEELEIHLKELQSDVQKEMRKSSSVWELFIGKQYRRAVIIAAGLKVPQILTGIVTIQQYLGLIIQEANMSMDKSTGLIIYAAIRFVVSFMSSFFVDRVGRVPLLVYSYLGTGISLATVGAYFYYYQSYCYDAKDHSDTWLIVFSYIAFMCIVLANIISTVGYNSITSVIQAEIFPLNVKDVAMTSLNIFGGCLGMAVARGYEGVKSAAGLCGVFWCFACMALAGALCAGLLLPETRGKSLREIQRVLQGDLYDDTSMTVATKMELLTSDTGENGDCQLKELHSK